MNESDLKEFFHVNEFVGGLKIFSLAIVNPIKKFFL